MILHYEEGPDSLDIKLGDRWVLAVRGEPLEVTEEEAGLLLALPGWEEVPSVKDPEEGN